MPNGPFGPPDLAHTRGVFLTDRDGNPTSAGSAVTIQDSVGDSAMDDANNALRVNVVASTGGGLTDAELRATPVPVSGTVSVSEPLSVDDNAGSLTVDDGAGSLTVDNATISVVGGGVEATAQRVTIASDSTGVLSVDDNGASLTVDGAVAVSSVAQPTGLGTAFDGRQVVTTAGTRVQLSAQACNTVALTAETDNTGVVVVGAATVVAAVATRRGTPLAAGDTVILGVSNMNVLYMDSTVNGDGVTWTVLA